MYLMCTLYANLYVLLTRGPHTVYHGDLIYISYLHDEMWLVGIAKDKNKVIINYCDNVMNCDNKLFYL